MENDVNWKIVAIIFAVIVFAVLGYQMFAEGDFETENRSGPPEAFDVIEE